MALLGCIADDFTGATDLCSTLVKQGMRTLQLIDVPGEDDARRFDAAGFDAVVVALKSRSIAAADAVAQSRAALDWLAALGCRQFFFKYCSTFDSTDDGNIGPVADALLDALGADFTIACPAFPETGRTLFLGHLFVNGEPLAESPLKDHPLNPMRDSNLLRVLGRQTPNAVGLVRYDEVARGVAATAAAFARLRGDGVRHAIVDAIDDAQLLTIGHACAELRLLTGGSGVALGLADNFRRQGLLDDARDDAATLPSVGGDAAAAVLSGSCSAATLAQIEQMQKTRPSFALSPLALADAGAEVTAEAIAWATQNLRSGPVLVYASAPADEVRRAQQRLGRERAGELVERALAAVARALVDGGVDTLVVAGGETSGAVVQALGVRALHIGPQIDPGVPWTVALGGARPLALALKSGNFGAEDFFDKALRQAP